MDDQLDLSGSDFFDRSQSEFSRSTSSQPRSAEMTKKMELSNQNEANKQTVPQDSPPRRRRRRQADDLYSPKKVAAAIGVSESSLKRWCDAGYIQATKTAGGHRRVSRAEVIAFVKRKQYDLRDPTAIGLPDIRDIAISDDRDAVAQLSEALRQGDEAGSRKLLVHMYIEGRTVPDLFDRIIAPAFKEIGELWQCGNLEIYRERVACQICQSAAQDIRSLIPPAREGAPLAIGCTLEGDHYQLATMGVEMSLTTFGWRATSLGANIPIDSLYQAFEDQMPQMVWISVSHCGSEENLVRDVNRFAAKIANRAEIVLGGGQLTPEIRSQIQGVTFCDNFAQLVLAAQKINTRR